MRGVEQSERNKRAFGQFCCETENLRDSSPSGTRKLLPELCRKFCGHEIYASVGGVKRQAGSSYRLWPLTTGKIRYLYPFYEEKGQEAGLE